MNLLDRFLNELKDKLGDIKEECLNREDCENCPYCTKDSGEERDCYWTIAFGGRNPCEWNLGEE